MKMLILYLQALVLLLMLSATNLRANHLVGADLTYTYTGVQNVYLLKLRVYRDCDGIGMPPVANISYQSITSSVCAVFTMPFVSSQTIPHSLCLATIPSCPGGAGSIEEFIYEELFVMPFPASDWEFHWSDCCLNNSSNVQPNGIYASCMINNLNAPQNNSPYFIDQDFHITSIGIINNLSLNAQETDGDSLVYTFVQPNDGFICPGPPTPVTYTTQFGFSNPFASSIPITFDPVNAILHFNPSATMFSQIAVRTDEYRNGILIGSVMRELQIQCYPFFLPVSPSFEPQILKANNGFIQAFCNDSKVLVTFDTSYDCTSAVPSDFRTLDPMGIPNPVIAVKPIGCNSGYADTLELTFLNPLIIGTTYLWVKKGVDGNTLISACGYEMQELADTVQILVLDQSAFSPAHDSLPCYNNEDTIQLADHLFCWTIATDGSDLRLEDAVGNVYPVTAASMNCQGGIISDKLIISYQVPLNAVNPLRLYADSTGATDGNSVANRCGHFLLPSDTLAVLNFGNIIPLDLIPDTSLCEGEVLPSLSCGTFGTATYAWYKNGQLIPGEVQPVYQPVTGGIYMVVASGGGCTGIDSMILTIHQNPVVSLQDSVICDGDPWPLLNAGNQPGHSYVWGYNNVFFLYDTLAVYQTYTNGLYSVIVTDTLGCEGIDSMVLIRNSSPGFTIDPITLCQGQTAWIDCGVSGAEYLWSTGETTSSVQVSTPGIYTLTITVNGCSAVDTAAVTLSDYPEAPQVSCINGTTGYSDVFIWNAISGALFYQVSEDGGITWINPNTPVGTESHGFNNAPAAFVVRAIGPPPCDTGLVSTPTGCALVIPNIFTPNGDNINDFFEIRNIRQYPACVVSVQNRWGKEVFKEHGYNNADKRFTGENQPDGVYLYLIDLGNGIETYRGTVAISR